MFPLGGVLFTILKPSCEDAYAQEREPETVGWHKYLQNLSFFKYFDFIFVLIEKKPESLKNSGSIGNYRTIKLKLFATKNPYK